MYLHSKPNLEADLVSNLDQLVSALRRDTPEDVLKAEIRRRRGDILKRLQQGESYELRDFRGKVIRITPQGHKSPDLSPKLSAKISIEKQPA